jgi:hypothetical protein
MIVQNGVHMLESEKVPIFETPEIRRNDSPLRNNFNPRIANKDKSTKPAPWAGPDARSDLIRGFSLKGLRKWLKGVKGVNLNKVTDSVIIGNIGEMRTLSIALQKHIHGVCQSLSTKLKQLDLKLKEIKAVENKIFQLKPGFVKKSMKKIKSKSAKLKKALKKEKKLVKKILKQMLKKQKKVLKVLSVYDKNFAKKNKTGLNQMMTVMNKSLQSYMKHSYFKKAYQPFITFFLRKAKGFKKKQFKNADATARNFVAKHWRKFFNKEKKKWEKEQAKKEAKKRNKKNKKHKNRN